jgi:hypothetical protein
MRVQDTAKRNKYYHCLEYDHDQSGDICLVACGMEQCDPGVNYGPDVRDCYHLHVILSGKAFFELICRMHEQPEMNYINDLRRRGILLEFLALALEATETRTKKNSRRNEVGTEVYISRSEFLHRSI